MWWELHRSSGGPRVYLISSSLARVQGATFRVLRASRLPHLHANRSRRAPIDMNGAGTEESTKILKHKPEQPSILGHHPGCQQFLKSKMKSLGN